MQVLSLGEGLGPWSALALLSSPSLQHRFPGEGWGLT